MNDEYKLAGSGPMSFEHIGPGDLLPRADALCKEGWRIVQILAVSLAEGVELSYAFGLVHELRILRFVAAPGSPVPSLTPVFPAAFLYENEIHDLFGVAIERIAVDWLGKTYDVSEPGRFDLMRLNLPSVEEGGR